MFATSVLEAAKEYHEKESWQSYSFRASKGWSLGMDIRRFVFIVSSQDN